MLHLVRTFLRRELSSTFVVSEQRLQLQAGMDLLIQSSGKLSERLSAARFAFVSGGFQVAVMKSVVTVVM
jgi:hypothetical protein